MKSVHRHVEMFDRNFQITNSIIMVLVGHPRSAYQTQLHAHQFELDFNMFNMFAFFLYFKMKKNRFLQYLNCAYVLITLPFDTLLLDEQLGQICACLHTYLFSNRACMYHRETYPTKHWTSDRYAGHVYAGSVGP